MVSEEHTVGVWQCAQNPPFSHPLTESEQRKEDSEEKGQGKALYPSRAVVSGHTNPSPNHMPGIIDS